MNEDALAMVRACLEAGRGGTNPPRQLGSSQRHAESAVRLLRRSTSRGPIAAGAGPASSTKADPRCRLDRHAVAGLDVTVGRALATDRETWIDEEDHGASLGLGPDWDPPSASGRKHVGLRIRLAEKPAGHFGHDSDLLGRPLHPVQRLSPPGGTGRGRLAGASFPLEGKNVGGAYSQVQGRVKKQVGKGGVCGEATGEGSFSPSAPSPLPWGRM